MPGRFLKPSDVAKMCAVTPAGVRKWIRSGKLKAYSTPGGQYRIEEDDLRHFLSDHGMPMSKESASSSRPTILVVDNEPDTVALIRETLSAEYPDHKILAAYDGYDACILAGAERPQVLVMDFAMPGLDGLEVARHVQTSAATGAVSIVVVTAFDSLLTSERLGDLDISGFVQKPFVPATLMAEVRKAFDRGAAERRAAGGG